MYEQITHDLKVAMKARDGLRTSVLRQLLAALKNKRIELMQDLTDHEVIGVTRTIVKQYRDAIEDFRRGGREDLIRQLSKEIEILETYVPRPPSPDEVRALVKQKVEALGATGANDFGKVMGAVMKDLGSAASGNEVSKIVRELIGVPEK